MESSKQPVGVFKGRYANYRTKHTGVRCTSVEQYLEDEDSFEPMLRYSNSKQAARAEQRERALSRIMGNNTRPRED